MLAIRYQTIFFLITAVVLGASLLSLILFGLKPGVDFTGGTLVEVSYVNGRPDQRVVAERLNTLPFGAYSIRPSGEGGYIVRTRELNAEEQTALKFALSFGGESDTVISRLTSIGPTLGTELRNKAFVALALVVVSTIIYIAFAFRQVSKPVSSWKYGIIAILTLFHDVMVPTGVFSFLGGVAGVEIDALFVVALLTILGYSVNDTIIIFDRIRENLRINMEHNHKELFAETVGKSLTQTYGRSINTSLSVVLVLLALLVWGGASTQMFMLALLVGVAAGSYSSIFLAAPLLVALERWQRR